MYRIIFLLIICIVKTPAQDTAEFTSIGRFSNARDFFINPAGFIYVADINTNKLYKLDTLGRIMKEIGGYGWNESAFDYPVDVFATPLNLYVTDMNNHRVQWFDKDLNFLSLIQTRNAADEKLRFGYPLSCSVTSQGDLLILDSENNRMIKFDMFGQFLTEFGGLDAGKFRIKKPTDFVIQNNLTFVLDNKGKRIVVFDQFGTGLNIIKIEFTAENMSVSGQNILLNDDSSVYLLDVDKTELKKIFTIKDASIQDVSIFNEHIYVLTPKSILIYPFN